MIYTIDLLSPQTLDKILKIYHSAPFKEGQMTNPNNKFEKRLQSDVKHVLQMDDEYYLQECHKLIYGEITNNQQFHDYTIPKMYDGVNLLEYKPGMKYNLHNDHYLMGKSRADYSCTIFLNSPEEYEGGELVLGVGNTDVSYKLNAGQCLIYPTGLKHRVNEVTSGSRKVIVLWIQSCIQDTRLRAVYQEVVMLINNHQNYITENKNLLDDLISVKYNILRNFGTF